MGYQQNTPGASNSLRTAHWNNTTIVLRNKNKRRDQLLNIKQVSTRLLKQTTCISQGNALSLYVCSYNVHFSSKFHIVKQINPRLLISLFSLRNKAISVMDNKHGPNFYIISQCNRKFDYKVNFSRLIPGLTTLGLD